MHHRHVELGMQAMPADILGCEFIAPKSNGSVRDGDPSLSQEIFDISMAQAEPEVEPDSVLNDLWRKSVALTDADVFIHLTRIARTRLTWQYPLPSWASNYGEFTFLRNPLPVGFGSRARKPYPAVQYTCMRPRNHARDVQ